MNLTFPAWQECDFYVPNDDPKMIWVAPFVHDAVENGEPR